MSTHAISDITLLYVAMVLARQLDSANRDLAELRREQSGSRWAPPSPARHLALVRRDAPRGT